VIDVGWNLGSLKAAVVTVAGKRFAGRSVYGRGKAGSRIAEILSDVAIDEQAMRKLIRY
jgi:hypothetical protein